MSGRRIREDHKEYHDLVRDKVKSRVKQHIKDGKKVKRHGDDMVVIDVPVIELPRFKHGDDDSGGIGAGEGELGDIVGTKPDDGDQPGKPGDARGEHQMGVGISIDSFMDILAEELELPNLQPKQNNVVITPKVKYNRISKIGNNSLLHKKKTLKNAIKRNISCNTFDPDNTENLYPEPTDKRFKSWSVVDKPDLNAVIFFMADISASMTRDKRELISEMCWYLENWIKRFYAETDIKYIVHDVQAQEVDHDKFYDFTSGGGTMISSAFDLAEQVIDKSYPPDEWNIYLFYLSDGENWGGDNERCVKHMINLQKICSLIGITEVKGASQWAQFIQYIEEELTSGTLDSEIVVAGAVDTQDHVLRQLKMFLSAESIV
jgi:uncharacterized protein